MPKLLEAPQRFPVFAVHRRSLPQTTGRASGTLNHNFKQCHPAVLSQRELTDQQLVELYRRRWGIEVFYRHLKQTFQRRKLRSARADNARVELTWSVLDLWVLGFSGLIAVRRVGTAPGQVSVAGALRAIRRVLRDYRHSAERGQTLRRELQNAVVDSYPRVSKSSRDDPVKKRKQPPGSPKIKMATQQKIQQAKHVVKWIRKGLTA